ncbi:MAG: hypothetical protein AAFQ94_19060 [Bacteroidota bacterium]
MLLKQFAIFFVVGALLFACNTNQKIDREAIKKEMKSREIRRFTDSEVLMEAERVGGLATESSIEERSKMMTTYQLTFDTIRWNDTVQDSIVNSIVDVYRYANESGLDVSKGVQASTNKLFYYCIPLSDTTGSQGVTILTIPKKELVLNFPED